ncbi:asparaginase [Nocardioides donggukensis]|uniref:Asparaginase n=1 Tax=Nocardioides donggukensis TaxID=2774019 RepID=A0A927K5Q5_9ACTN|nr:asparaginase [Nocardioides donggukensis]MBD8868331.1 asparaginase [Nocardioides donggukensis]
MSPATGSHTVSSASVAASLVSPVVEPVVVAEIIRSGVVEGHHYGSVVATGRDGEVLWSVGGTDVPVFPRSCNKPIQALAMVRAGLDLPPDLLALACASHSGEPFHVEGVRRVLAAAGLDEAALRTPPDFPLDEDARTAVIAAGGERSPILMNCSGKHAAMLATCVANGWDTATYLDPQHPLQRAIAETFAELTGESVEPVAVDGCGAPLLSTSLAGLARAFARLATATEGPEHGVAEAIRSHPEMVSGSTRDERTLLEAVPGAIGKAGAESCYAVALPDGRAVALKCDDGAPRVRPVLMAEALRRLGVTDEEGVDGEAVRRTGLVELLGGGVPVGEIRATF